MAESHTKEHEAAYERATFSLKLQGILSIVFGSIGLFVGLIFMVFLAVLLADSYSNSDMIGIFVLFALTLLFWMVPHVYLIISGVVLQRLPQPSIVKTLTIINVVIGALWNYIMLGAAIYTLTQLGNYEKHRK